jgi:hypothetical protein
MKIEIKDGPQYCRYPNQLYPQPTYVEIDPAEGLVTYGFNAEIGTGVPLSVWHKHILRVPVGPCVSGGAVKEALDTTLIDRIIAGHSVQWDGNNHVGRLTEDAQEALQNLELELSNIEADVQAVELLDGETIEDWQGTGDACYYVEA